MRELLERLSESIIEATRQVKPKTYLVDRFSEKIVPDVGVNVIDLAREFRALPITQSNHPAPTRTLGVEFAYYPLADLRYKNYLTPDEIRAWEKVQGDFTTVIAEKVARGIEAIAKTQDILLAKGLTGSISHELFPSGTFSVSFGSPISETWDSGDIIENINRGINALAERGWGGEYILFVGKNVYNDILTNDETKTLIQAQSFAGAVLRGEANLIVQGVEVVFMGYTVSDVSGTYKLVPDNKAYLVSRDAVINVYGLPNVIQAQPTRYQPIITYNEHDLQGIEILVASRYLPVVFATGIVEFTRT